MIELQLMDADATTRLGATLAASLGAAGVVYLEGNLGAGKTTLARGFLRARGVDGSIRSPTYTLMEPYATPSGAVLHLDLYRLVDPLELHNLGLMDHSPANTLWLVEWPDRGGALLPPSTLRLRLSMEDNGRRAVVDSQPDIEARIGELSQNSP
jgi:tRNA threonylcarbamoyladenosine biosynthesis protein TsaE